MKLLWFTTTLKLDVESQTHLPKYDIWYLYLFSGILYLISYGKNFRPWELLKSMLWSWRINNICLLNRKTAIFPSSLLYFYFLMYIRFQKYLLNWISTGNQIFTIYMYKINLLLNNNKQLQVHVTNLSLIYTLFSFVGSNRRPQMCSHKELG
jgi:hypothetical protein